MTVDQIITEWNQDAPITALDLGKQARQIPQLHAKYLALYRNVKNDLVKLRSYHKQLRAEKREWLNNPTAEHHAQGWVYPKRKILKNEYNDFLDADPHIMDAQTKVDLAEIRFEVISEIMKQINNRNWFIQSAIKDRSFLNGD